MNAKTRADQQVIVMLGMHRASSQRGGIASVVDVYEQGGLFARWPIHYLGTVIAGSMFAKTRVFASALLEFVTLLVMRRVALLHSNTSSRASFWRKSIFIVAAMVARRPVILHLHSGGFVDFYREECGPVRRWLIRLILNKVDRVVALSPQWKRALETIVPEAKITVVFNPVAIPTSPHSRTARESHTVLFLGRMNQAKGFFDLLEAIAIVKRHYQTVQLRCAGHGDFAAIQDRVRKLGIEDSVKLLGWVSGTAKEQELASAAVYVLPSYFEGLPMGVLEAMAFGAPVVATSVGGIPDAIVDGVSGFLVKPGDVDALAQRLVRLIRDAELRESFAREAYSRAQQLFSTETVLAQIEDLYRSLEATPRPVNRGSEPIGSTSEHLKCRI